MGEVPAEWMEEVEWRINRPFGWNACWYLGVRRMAKGLAMLEDHRPYPKNPEMSVKILLPKKGWVSKVVKARPFIAQIFFEWDGIESWGQNYVSGYLHHRPNKHGVYKRVQQEKPRSHWEIKMTCGDDACINPQHFKFEPIPAVQGRKRRKTK